MHMHDTKKIFYSVCEEAKNIQKGECLERYQLESLLTQTEILKKHFIFQKKELIQQTKVIEAKIALTENATQIFEK